MNVAKPFWIRLGTVLGIWLALAVMLTGQGYLLVYSARQAQSDIGNILPPLALWELFLSNVVECVIWAFLTLGISGWRGDSPLDRENGCAACSFTWRPA